MGQLSGTDQAGRGEPGPARPGDDDPGDDGPGGADRPGGTDRPAEAEAEAEARARAGAGTWTGPEAGEAGPAPAPAPDRWRPGLGMVLVAVPVFVAVTLGVVTILSNAPAADRAPRTAVPADRGSPPEFVDPANARAVTAPLQGRDEASFDLLTGTSAVRLTVSDLGDRLYRISTPPRAGVLPRPELQRDRVLLHLVPSGESGPGAVDIELNSRVRWQLRLTGGAAEQSLDLGRARLAGVELLGGATRIELTLPPPEGTLTVRMSGGVNQFLVRAPAGPPARVRLANGAAAVVLDGDRRSGIARGAVLTSAGWANADERFDIDLVAGVATLTVQRR